MKKNGKKKTSRGGRIHNVSMFDYLSKKYGISKAWLAKQLGLTAPGFQYAEERGFREEEVQIIEQALKAMAYDLLEFKVPDSMRYETKNTGPKKEAA